MHVWVGGPHCICALRKKSGWFSGVGWLAGGPVRPSGRFFAF